ncbi:17560_t:CDS:2 [Racocetra persica]|uniref:17560_t:CDS:1 n=1 Tax=Racocetra persica TaxID=160502 RepID=A0ACA9KEG0_9GLOM|nr:17560_t:CDS:2 [Racocetra persica]
MKYSDTSNINYSDISNENYSDVSNMNFNEEYKEVAREGSYLLNSYLGRKSPVKSSISEDFEIVDVLNKNGIKYRAYYTDNRIVLVGKYEDMNFIIHYVKRDWNSIGKNEIILLINDLEHQQSEFVVFFVTNYDYHLSAINQAATNSKVFLCYETTIVDKIKDAARAEKIKNSNQSDVIIKRVKIDKEKNISIDEILMRNSDFKPF